MMADGEKTDSSVTVKIETAGNVNVADNIFNIYRTQGHDCGRHGQIVLDWHKDDYQAAETNSSRSCFVQTTTIPVKIWPGRAEHRDVTVANKVVNVFINDRIADQLHGRNELDFKEYLGKCVVDMKWPEKTSADSVETVEAAELVVFKLKVVGDRTKELLDSMLDIISNTTNLRTMETLVKKAFYDFGKQLRQIRIGCLEFVFEDSESGANLLQSDRNMRGRIIKYLLDFLPDWVSECAQWDVRTVSAADFITSSSCEDLVLSEIWQIPLMPYYDSDAWSPDPEFMESIRALLQLRHFLHSPKISTVPQKQSSTHMIGDGSPQQHIISQQLESRDLQHLPQGGGEEGSEGDEEGMGEGDERIERKGGDGGVGGVCENEERTLNLSLYESFSPELKSLQDGSQASQESSHYPPITNPKDDVALKKGDGFSSARFQTKPVIHSQTFPNRPINAIAAPVLGQPDSNQSHIFESGSYDPSYPHAVKEEDRYESYSGYDPCPNLKEESEHGSYTPSDPASVSGKHKADDTMEGDIWDPTSEYQLDPKMHPASQKFFNKASTSRPSYGHESGEESDAYGAVAGAGKAGGVLLDEGQGGPPDQEPSGAFGGVPRKRESKTLQAEQLLNWVNVKSRASQSHDPEIKRLMEQVEESLQDEEQPSPKARALDTVIALDTSSSVVQNHLDELKSVVHTFIDGIEENVDNFSLEENLAVVQIGDRAWVRQHLTNDYNRVREAVDAMTPDSKEMPTGGRTPLFQALMVCLGAIEGRGGVVNVAGCHRVRPRLIFFTDGRPTDEATESGADIQSNVNEVKFALVQLISEFASKKHKTTPTPIFWVSIGANPDYPFLESLAALSGGKVVVKDKVEELCRYYKIQETIGCVYKMVRKHKDVYSTDEQIMAIVSALGGNLDEDEKKLIVEEVKKKQKDPEHDTGEANDFDSVYEDTDNVSKGTLLPLGTRVVRGPDWKWENQDSEGAGTVIQHRKKQDGWLHVMWDNDTHNAYRYGDDDCKDVVETKGYPRQLGSQLIDIGVRVERGEDWKSGEEDGRGEGVVIRKRKDGKVRVRWENGNIGKYKFGKDGVMELKILTPAAPYLSRATAERQPGQHPVRDEELGAVGGADPNQGPQKIVWYWKDNDRWIMYSAEHQDKLNAAYKQRTDGSCVIHRDGKHRRVLFKQNREKTVDKGGMLEVKHERMSEQDYYRKLEEND